jgi:hypothetical protein
VEIVHFISHNACFNAKTCIRVKVRVGLDFDDNRKVVSLRSSLLVAMFADISDFKSVLTFRSQTV